MPLLTRIAAPAHPPATTYWSYMRLWLSKIGVCMGDSVFQNLIAIVAESEKKTSIPIILLFLKHFTAYIDTNFWYLKIVSFQNSVPRAVTLILSTDESMLQYIKENYWKNSKNCRFYSIFTALYSINSIFNQEIFENLVWSDRLSISGAHPIGYFSFLTA